MRLVYITVPFSIFLIAGGVWMATTASTSRNTANPVNGMLPKHPVTLEMARDADAMARKTAPDFSLSDLTGKQWTLAESTAGKPLFIYFILNNCPCSTDAEPLFHKLYERYKGRINFVGVIGSDLKVASQWAKDHSVPYTLLSDPNCKVIHAYDAKHSVYNALVTPDGKIEKMWPGYSQDVLKEINAKMAAATSTPEKPFDPEYAPVKLSSGCLFPTKA